MEVKRGCLRSGSEFDVVGLPAMFELFQHSPTRTHLQAIGSRGTKTLFDWAVVEPYQERVSELSHSHTRSLTHSLTHSINHSLTHSLTHSSTLSSYKKTLLHAAGYSFTAGYHDYNTVIDIKVGNP